MLNLLIKLIHPFYIVKKIENGRSYQKFIGHLKSRNHNSKKMTIIRRKKNKKTRNLMSTLFSAENLKLIKKSAKNHVRYKDFLKNDDKENNESSGSQDRKSSRTPFGFI